MPIDLSKPLKWTDHTSDPDIAALLKDLQGNILKGHGREHTVNLFLQFDNPDSGRAFVNAMADKVDNALNQLIAAQRIAAEKADRPCDYVAPEPHSSPFVAFFLSAAGYRALDVPDTGPTFPRDPAFREGLKLRFEALADPAPLLWDMHFRPDIHAMVLLANTTAAFAATDASNFKATLPPGITVLGEEIGIAYHNANGDGVEHFGYVDGRSQPLLLAEDVEKERTSTDGISVWDPAFGANQALVDSPGGDGPLSMGSYFVFRKLEQNVKGFKAREEALAGELGLCKGDEELAGALIVGRFEDGTPVILQKREGMHNPVPNNFDYRDDPEGLKCPFSGHIRKTNPRGDSVRMGPRVSLEQERSHIMARRGITYGKRDLDENKEFLKYDYPEGEVGLLFMAYQNNIANQFEFTQRFWANNEDFALKNTGIDPVIGQHTGPIVDQTYPKKWGEPATHKFTFADFVKMLGGEYFFAPSISTLRNL